MANISIIDTGRPNISYTGEAASVVANSGTAIVLKAVEVNYDVGAGLDDTPVIGKYSESEVNFSSTENGKFTINGILRRDTTADMDLIPILKKLVTTKGIKLLYYNSTTDGYRDITDSLGTDYSTDTHQSNNFSGTATPHLHIRVKSFSIRHSTNTLLLRYTLTCIETG